MSSKGDAAPAGRKEDDDQDPTLDEQLDAIGWGRFQFLALTAFILFIVADGMEVPSSPPPLFLPLGDAFWWLLMRSSSVSVYFISQIW